MRQRKQTFSENLVKDIERKTRKQYSANEEIRIVHRSEHVEDYVS